MSVDEFKGFQELMRTLYYEKDLKRGLWKTFAWFIEEVGELSEAIKNEDKDKISEEMVDVIAWLMSLANLLNVDVHLSVRKKYGSLKCPRCKSSPCQCPESF